VLDAEFFRSLGLMIVAAAILALGMRLLRLPTIGAYLVAGLLLGPATGLIEISPAIDLISELGIVLLLFLVGLELNLAKIKEVGLVAMVAALVQVTLSAAAGFGLALLLGFDLLAATLLGIALAFSSTVVVVKLLSDTSEIDTIHGRIAIGILLVQDLLVIVVLTVLTGIAEGGSLDPWALTKSVLLAFGGLFLLGGGVLAAARWLLPAPFAWAAANPSTLYIWSLCWCFLVVTAAHLGHLSIELGAFLAGLALAQLPYTRDLQHRIKPLMNFCVAIFFVALGVKVTPAALGSELLPATVFAVGVLILKPLILMVVITRMRFAERTGFLSGISLAQVSEFSLILMAIAAEAGLAGDRLVTDVTLAGMLTIAASSYLMITGRKLYAFCHGRGWLRFLRAKHALEKEAEHPWRQHILVIGMNTLGIRIVQALHERGERVVAIDNDPRKLQGLPCETIHANVEFHDVLEELGLPHAKLLVSALQIEHTNDLLAYRCQQAGVPCSVVAVDLSVMENLLDLGVTWVMLPKVDVVRFQEAVLREQGLLKGEHA